MMSTVVIKCAVMIRRKTNKLTEAEKLPAIRKENRLAKIKMCVGGMLI